MKVYYCMEMMRKPLETLCKDNDVVMISDCDEIPNPKTIEWVTMFKESIRDDNIYGFKMAVYYYWLNNRCSEEWIGTILTSYAKLKEKIINEIKQKGSTVLLDGGWHFTYQGGEAEVRRKLVTTRTPGEQDPTDSYYGTPTEMILDNMRNNRDIFTGRFNDPNRAFQYWKDEDNWPDYLKENRVRYRHLCLEML